MILASFNRKSVVYRSRRRINVRCWKSSRNCWYVLLQSLYFRLISDILIANRSSGPGCSSNAHQRIFGESAKYSESRGSGCTTIQSVACWVGSRYMPLSRLRSLESSNVLLLDMAATMERLSEYKTYNGQFCKRLFDFLSIMFTAQSRLLLGDNNGVIKPARGKPSLRNHRDFETYLGRYAGLMLYLKEMDETVYGKLCAVRPISST